MDGFSQVDITSLREEMLAELSNSNYTKTDVELAAPTADGDLYRVGELAIYGVDALCRRSDYLQQTVLADDAFVGLNPLDAGPKGFVDGSEVKVSQGDGHAILPVRIFNELPEGAVWVKSATDVSTTLGDSFGPISVEAV